MKQKVHLCEDNTHKTPENYDTKLSSNSATTPRKFSNKLTPVDQRPSHDDCSSLDVGAEKPVPPLPDSVLEGLFVDMGALDGALIQCRTGGRISRDVRHAGRHFESFSSYLCREFGALVNRAPSVGQVWQVSRRESILIFESEGTVRNLYDTVLKFTVFEVRIKKNQLDLIVWIISK